MSEQQRQAAQAALEATRNVPADEEYDGEDLDLTIIGLEAALAEPQPEPVAVVPREFRSALRALAFMARTSGGTAGPDSGLMAALNEAERVLALPYLNAAPQAQQPLTDEQIDKLMHTVPGFMGTHWIAKFARAIERAHKIGVKA